MSWYYSAQLINTVLRITLDKKLKSPAIENIMLQLIGNQDIESRCNSKLGLWRHSKSIEKWNTFEKDKVAILTKHLKYLKRPMENESTNIENENKTI